CQFGDVFAPPDVQDRPRSRTRQEQCTQRGRTRIGSAPFWWSWWLLRGDDVDVEASGDLRVQLQRDLVAADRLDVAGQLQAAPVDVRTARGLDRRGDLGRGDRAEQPPTIAGPSLQGHPQVLQLGLDLGGVVQVADLPGRTSPLDQRDLLLRALGPQDREALRQE